MSRYVIRTCFWICDWHDNPCVTTDHVTLLLPFCCAVVMLWRVALDCYVKLGFILYYTFSRIKRKSSHVVSCGCSAPSCDIEEQEQQRHEVYPVSRWRYATRLKISSAVGLVYSIDCPKTVTHPSANRARRALTSFMRQTPLTTTPRRQPSCNLYMARRRRRTDVSRAYAQSDSPVAATGVKSDVWDRIVLRRYRGIRSIKYLL